MNPGSSFGHYRLGEPLGKGGMGEVFRAHDKTLRRDVAIKLLPRELADDPERLARLRREARSLAALDHPGIATVHGFEEHEGIRFIVMELVEGETLEERLRRGSLPLGEALEVALQVARAIEAAHDRGIIHRDLKAANIKITPDGRVKVLDFGLAKALADPSDDRELPTETFLETATGAVLGTVPYMSPEQCRGMEVDQRTDIWAIGCLLYELLAGGRAFPADTQSDCLATILTKEPDWQGLPEAVPTQIRNLLRRCLQKDLKRRLQHVGDARIEIEETLDGLSSRPSSGEGALPAAAETAGSPSRRRAPFVSRRLVVPLAGALLAGALATTWFLLREPEPEITDRSIAVLPFESLGTAEPTLFTEGIHGDLLTHLSRVSSLKVTSRTSVMPFRDSAKSLPAIAEELGVGWVLSAEVQQVGDEVQVNARLLDAHEDQQVWAESYRRALTADNLFQIQEELTKEIAEQLAVQLSPDERRRLEGSPTDDLEAYRLYLQGRVLVEQRTAEEMRQSVEYFRRAIDREPDYALARVGLADALTLLADYGYEAPDELIPDAERAVRRALAIEPELAEAHASLGLIHTTRFRRQGPAAVRGLERAIELQPSYADAHNWLAWIHLLLGNAREALPSARRAVELNPLSPEALSNLAWSSLGTGDATSALHQARRTAEVQPDFGTAYFLEALALYRLGRYTEAETILRGLSVPWAGEGPKTALALTLVAAGEEDEARQVLAELQEAGDPADAGLVLAALGEVDASFAAFQRVDSWQPWPTLAVHHCFAEVLAALESDPRYGRILDDVRRSWRLEPH